jgi:hypothetical protein
MYSSRSYSGYRKPKKNSKNPVILLLMIVLLLGGGYLFYNLVLNREPAEKLLFDTSVSENEKQLIAQKIEENSIDYKGVISVSTKTATEISSLNQILSVYVPVTNVYSSRQSTPMAELTDIDVYIPEATEDIVKNAIAESIGIPAANLLPIQIDITDIAQTDIAFIPTEQLTKDVKLLSFNGSYYLDNFTSGAVFRYAEYIGDQASVMTDVNLTTLSNKDTVLKVNMTGVTALTRVMLNKLAQVGDPLYFSQIIGDFLADADITHVSNEVSFKENCEFNRVLFCSPPEMIEVLKASGVDLVELTGNHNNDFGSEYNTDTINLYKELGWEVIGGGLNAEDAKKPFITDQKGSKLAFLAYNYPDSPNGVAIAGASTAGANSFDFDRIKTEIESAKQQASSVIVNVQFWECYAYPDGYVEFPQCSSPIPNQKEVFRELIDLGADMVVGSSAHQPQTYELYNGKPIYYGLGNLYFDQTQWPGTERGIVLTNYYIGGELLQTKLSPTVFDTDLQVRLMTEDEAVDLLEKLHTARIISGL